MSSISGGNNNLYNSGDVYHGDKAMQRSQREVEVIENLKRKFQKGDDNS